MKREYVIYSIVFFVGCISVNLLERWTGERFYELNRYQLSIIQIENISYERFFLQVLVTRFKTVFLLWVLSKVIPKKAIALGFACLLSGMLGATLTMIVISNGLWGILYCGCVLFPQGILYILALRLWESRTSRELYSRTRKEEWLGTLIMISMVFIGCIYEAFICPKITEILVKI